MKYFFFMLLVLGTNSSYAQTISKTTIKWSNDETWDQITAKAKFENKYIMIDCFATWCGPCKKMDSEVFTNESVVNLINRKFISVHIQFDTTANDNENVIYWRTVSTKLGLARTIDSFPSFLFFDFSGKLIHKSIGFQSVTQFTELLEDVQVPQKQFYTLVKALENNDLSREAFIPLTKYAKSIGEGKIDSLGFNQFIYRFANSPKSPNSLSKEEWFFIAEHLNNLKLTDQVVKFILKNANSVDSITSKNFSKKLADAVIYNVSVKSKVNAALKTRKMPDWTSIEENIKISFGEEYIGDKIINGKIAWYKETQQWVQYVKALTMLIESGDIENVPFTWQGGSYLNNAAWEVFVHSDVKKNKLEIITALKWVNKAMVIASQIKNGMYSFINALDTKANLLYKLGNVNEAIKTENEARLLAIKLGDKNNEKVSDNNLKKMRARIPTW